MFETNMYKNAYLELVIGPMFSGKTSYLLDVYKNVNCVIYQLL